MHSLMKAAFVCHKQPTNIINFEGSDSEIQKEDKKNARNQIKAVPNTDVQYSRKFQINY